VSPVKERWRLSSFHQFQSTHSMKQIAKPTGINHSDFSWSSTVMRALLPTGSGTLPGAHRESPPENQLNS